MTQHLKTSSAEAPISIYSNGMKIYRQGDPSGSLYLVQFGCVLLARATYGGNHQVGGFFFPNEVFGWESEVEHCFSAESAGTTGIRVFGPAKDPAATEWRHKQLLPSLTRLREQLLIVSLGTADARLAAFFCDLVERNGNDLLALPMHRLDIAAYLGISPETVSRVLRRFKDAGIVSVPSTHYIKVLNLPALQQIQ